MRSLLPLDLSKYVFVATVSAVVGLAGCGDGNSNNAPPSRIETADDVRVPQAGVLQETVRACLRATDNTCPEDAPFAKLSDYNLVELAQGKITPTTRLAAANGTEGAGTIVPYDLNTPLFSDYAFKFRTMWIPPDATIGYTETGPLDFPDGTIFTKTFSFPADFQNPGDDIRVIETRVLLQEDGVWMALPYVWNDDQTEAYLAPTGKTVPVTWRHFDGSDRGTDYPVPNMNQCLDCHSNIEDGSNRKVMSLIGPKAKHLNREYNVSRFFPEVDRMNQLALLSDLGLLEGAPSPEQAPKLATFDDPDSGTLNQRARAYLDANCAHCHSPRGTAKTSGLILLAEEDNPNDWGVCQTIQRGIGGDEGAQVLDIVPGAPQDSAVVLRMKSLQGEVMMPTVGRTVNHEEGIALIEEWVTWLGTAEAVEQLGLQGFDCGQ